MACVLETSYETKYQPEAHFLDKPEDWSSWFHEGEIRRGGRDGKAIPPGRAVPSRVEIGTRRKSLPDFFPITDEIGVSQAFRDVVEELEPGVHQFFPVDVRQRNGKEVEGKYYLFVCCQLIDTAVVAERSDVSKSEPSPGSQFWYYDLLSSIQYEEDPSYPIRHSGNPRVILDSSIIRNKHFWIERRLPRDLFVSNAARDRMQIAELEGFVVNDRYDVLEG